MASVPRPTPLIVYLGPSLPLEEARALLPEADFRPPIRRGDLAQVPSAAVVALIDGAFERAHAVQPREIERAIARGVAVLGGGTLGALRATEARGMSGIGRVHRMYQEGSIAGEDEVALAFDPRTLRSLTEPLACVRHALQALRRAGTIDAPIADAILRAALALPARERTFPGILAAAGLDRRPDAKRLVELLASYDLKREDAHLVLEQLPRFREQAVFARLARSGVRPRARRAPPLSAAAPLVIAEFGDRVDFRDLVLFLKMTNRFLPHARSALARFLLEGNKLDARSSRRLRSVPDAAGVFVALQREWGWRDGPETNAALGDLGVSLAELAGALEEEAAAQRAVAAEALEEDDELLGALRAELLIDELALKREAIRLGALRSFAAAGPAPTAAEREAARRTIALAHGELRWERALVRLGDVGVAPGLAEQFAADLARARGAAGPIVRALDGRASQGRGARPPRVALAPRALEKLGLRRCPKAPGSKRFSLPIARADAIARRAAKTIGVSSVGPLRGVGGLGVQVAVALRPGSPWTSGVGSGKAQGRVGARVGAILEECEKWAQEQAPQAQALRLGSYAQLRRRLRLVRPTELDLPHDSAWSEDAVIGWSPTVDLLSGDTVYIPSGAVTLRRSRGDPFYSLRRGGKWFSTNGLASGFRLEEATLHALCEAIERHARRMSELQLYDPGKCGGARFAFVDRETLPAGCRRLVERFQRAGMQVRLLDMTGEIRVPSFTAIGALDGPDGHRLTRGHATHPDPEVALTMALLELAQSHAGESGGKDGATIRVRSLGRDERPVPVTAETRRLFYGPDHPRIRFQELAGFIARDLLEELRWTCARVRDAGFTRVLVFDTSAPEIAPVRVVRVIVPGFETNNSLYSGPRARATVLRDLLG